MTCRVCGGYGFVAYKQTIDDGYGEVDSCPACGDTMSLDIDLIGIPTEPMQLYSANFTHNATKMADAAGLYKPIWRPNEVGITTAGQLIKPLQLGIEEMIAYPEKFIALQPPNGWGTYDQFLPWLRELLKACEAYPNAQIRVSR